MKILVKVRNLENYSENKDIILKTNFESYDIFRDRMCYDKDTLKEILAKIFDCDVTKIKQIKRVKCETDISSIMVNIKKIRHHVEFINYKELEIIEFEVK